MFICSHTGPRQIEQLAEILAFTADIKKHGLYSIGEDASSCQMKKSEIIPEDLAASDRGVETTLQHLKIKRLQDILFTADPDLH